MTAALVERRGLAGVLKALQQPDRDALELIAQLDEALPNGHQRQIAATFLASIRQLDEPARDLLRYAAVLAVAPIPSQLLVKALIAARRDDPSADADPDYAQDQVDRSTSQLLSTSLADDAGGGAITVHTLVSRTVRFAEPLPAAWATLRGRVVGVLNEEMAQAADIRQHAELAPWVTHARALSESAEDAATIGLLGWVARYDFERASFVLARPGFEREMAARKRVLGKQHPDTLTSMNNLATTVAHQGDLPGARRLQATAVAGRLRVLGAAHPDTVKAEKSLEQMQDSAAPSNAAGKKEK